jgi:hypothetical protein
MLVRGATSEANSYQPNPGSGLVGSILAGAALSTVLTAIAGLLF